MKKQIVGILVISGLMISSLAFAANTSATSKGSGPVEKTASTTQIKAPKNEEITGWRLNFIMERSTTTEKRLENRQTNIERLEQRLASTTATTSEKKIEKITEQIKQQVEQMNKVKDRLLNIELKAINILGKIANKIQTRINILSDKGQDMTTAREKLNLASRKLEVMTLEADFLANTIRVPVNASTTESLPQRVAESQNKLRTLAKETHSLLVETVQAMSIK
jgi:hypothetical protein